MKNTSKRPRAGSRRDSIESQVDDAWRSLVVGALWLLVNFDFSEDVACFAQTLILRAKTGHFAQVEGLLPSVRMELERLARNVRRTSQASAANDVRWPAPKQLARRQALGILIGNTIVESTAATLRGDAVALERALDSFPPEFVDESWLSCAEVRNAIARRAKELELPQDVTRSLLAMLKQLARAFAQPELPFESLGCAA